jgi:hypothetical protein
MQRLKKAAAVVVKNGGHHVSDAQGMDGLESVLRSYWTICNAGLLDPKQLLTMMMSDLDVPLDRYCSMMIPLLVSHGCM